jgi:hypothetical protein
LWPFPAQGQLWSQDFTANRFYGAGFWLELLAKLTEPQPGFERFVVVERNQWEKA